MMIILSRRNVRFEVFMGMVLEGHSLRKSTQIRPYVYIPPDLEINAERTKYTWVNPEVSGLAALS
jgi:hypothetical protein